MRFYLTLLFFLAYAFTSFAEDYAKLFTKGYQFYLRGDYPSAIEMFKQIPQTDGELFAQSAFYLGSIYAYQGSENAYNLLKIAVLNSTNTTNKQNAFNSFARFCMVNKKYKDVVDVSNTAEKTKWLSAENLFYVSQAHFYLGDEKASKNILEAVMQKYINDADCVGIDMFINAWLSSEDFTKCIDVQSLKNSLKNLTQAGLARIAILEKKSITQAQKDISFFAQIILAEQNSKIIDKKLFEEEIYKNRNAPFAWQGALILGKIYFNQKKLLSDTKYFVIMKTVSLRRKGRLYGVSFL